MKWIHKIAAYFVLLAGTMAVFFGIRVYRSNIKHPSDNAIEWAHLTLYLVVLGSLEMWFYYFK